MNDTIERTKPERVSVVVSMSIAAEHLVAAQAAKDRGEVSSRSEYIRAALDHYIETKEEPSKDSITHE